MVVTNLITFLSYVSICVTLLRLVTRTRRVIARDWYFFVVGFALFIVACGSTHLLDVITTWIPIFWVDATTNIVTAALSATVALLLIRRAGIIGFSINDYASRLGNAENEKRQMEGSLLAAQKLEDWSRASAVISHEIGQPLEAVQNLLYLIRTTEGVSPQVVDLAATAADEATRILTISRNSLSFFRHSASPEPTNLGAVAESVRFLLVPTAQKANVSIDIQSSGDLNIDAIPGETRQVLLNLVRNACEATTAEGETVAIALTGRSDDVEISIADHGAGMPPEILDALFEFGRSTKGDQGNGLGLWTVKHILDKHHATIHVDSRRGEGTRFIVHWPRKFAPAEPPELVAAHA